MIEPDATLFGNDDTTNDVVQGGLGDCYFLAGIHAYTEFPEIFKRIFVTTNANAAGMYLFNVYIRGIPTLVAIDDFLPTLKKKLIYTKVSTDRSTWVPLLEKVFAKVNGNYENIEGGNHAEAFKFLTNAPSTYFNVKKLNATSLYTIVSEADLTGNSMGLSTGAGSDTVQGVLGIPLGHAYTLMGLKDYTLTDGTVIQLYFIRNPHGVDSAFTGKYKDQVNDGNFLVDADELLLAFSALTISPMKSSWNYAYYSKESDLGLTSSYSFSLTQAQEATI